MTTYLDFASTTPMAPEVIEKMHAVMKEDSFGNPSSLDHEFGLAANKIVERSRAEVADLINANPDEILWTSGATESNNLAIVGAATRLGQIIPMCCTLQNRPLQIPLDPSKASNASTF